MTTVHSTPFNAWQAGGWLQGASWQSGGRRLLAAQHHAGRGNCLKRTRGQRRQGSSWRWARAVGVQLTLCSASPPAHPFALWTHLHTGPDICNHLDAACLHIHACRRKEARGGLGRWSDRH